MADKVKIMCYGNVEEISRDKAIERYSKAIKCSEGSERKRYCNILFGLYNGISEVYDEELDSPYRTKY